MKALFVDTACWMALADENDAGHSSSRRARDEWMEEGGVLVSTDYVMDETLSLIRMRLGIDAAARWWDQVDSSRALALGMDRRRASGKGPNVVFQVAR